MTIQLDATSQRAIWPRAPQPIIDAFCSEQGQAELERAGINHTRTRLSYAFSETEHETGGWSIAALTENIHYSAEGAAKTWPSRFPGGADQVREKYGTAAGWQLAMFDDVYGRRMGNRPGTRDGSRYIGRGGPQVTGRDGYAEIQRRTGIPCVENPELLTLPQHQPAILAAFWSWKNLNAKADAGDFPGCTRLWNGGQIGAADRERLLAGNDPIVQRLAIVERVKAAAETLPGSPPTAAPPAEVIASATATERQARAGAVAGAAGAAADQAVPAAINAGDPKPASVSGTQVAPPVPAPMKPFLPLWASGLAISIAVVLAFVCAVLIGRKVAAVKANWR